MREQEPINTLSVDTNITSATSEKISNGRKRAWGLASFLLGGTLITSLLTGIACGEQVRSNPPAPTVDPVFLGRHNVPWVYVDMEDQNGDGFYNRTDAHIQKEGNWRFDLKMEPDENGVFWINEDDLELIGARVCTIPVLPKYDINLDGHITQEDLEIVSENQGMVEEDPNPNARLDELDGGIVLDGNEQDITKRNHIRPQNTIQVSDPDCDPDS